MMKKILVVAGLIAGMMAANAWAGSATTCLQLVSVVNTSGRALKNNCSEAVEAAWCFGYDCKYNNSATIRPRQEFPLESNAGGLVSYDACSGANSIKSFNGSRITCR